MSHEQFYPTEAHKALKAYREAIPLFAALQTEYATISTPSSTGKPDFTSFVQLRELWRWVERLIWRGVVLSSRHRDQESLWAWLNHYNTTSTCWPPTFRTSHRSTISTIHLRALILRHGCLAPSPLHLRKSAAWVHTARSVIQDYRAILSMCTKFPRAGERNVRVEEFVDLCVAVWEGSGAVGEHAGWVLDVRSPLVASHAYAHQISLQDSLVGYAVNLQLLANPSTYDASIIPLRRCPASEAYTTIVHPSCRQIL